MPPLVAVLPIPDVNTTLIPDAYVTLHAMVEKDCCCSQNYNSCFTNLYPEELNAVGKHDDCNDDLGGRWNAWFDIPIKNIANDEVVVYIIITPNSNEILPGYPSNNITIRLQGMLLCTLCCC